MAVCRGFCRMFYSALFALCVFFCSNNVFADSCPAVPNATNIQCDSEGVVSSFDCITGYHKQKWTPTKNVYISRSQNSSTGVFSVTWNRGTLSGVARVSCALNENGTYTSVDYCELTSWVSGGIEYEIQNKRVSAGTSSTGSSCREENSTNRPRCYIELSQDSYGHQLISRTFNGNSIHYDCEGNTYAVIFNANGGSGSPSESSVTCTYGQNCPAFATQNTLTKTGFSFAGWNTYSNGYGTNYDAGTTTASNLTTTNNGTVNLYAKWVNTSITYELYGGTNYADAPSSYTYGVGTTINGTPTRANSTFIGWCSSLVDTGLTGCSETQTISSTATGAKKFYAKWACNEGYVAQNWYDTSCLPASEITLDNNGATSTGTAKLYTIYTTGVYLNSERTSAKSMTTSKNNITVPTKTGYTFGGYYSGVGGTGTQYINANGYITSGTSPNKGLEAGKALTSNATWYAKWTPNTYKVRFNINDGSGTYIDQNFTYDTSQNLANNTFTRYGFTFTGWNTVADGSGTSYTNGQSVNNLTTTNNGTVRLYAQWNVDYVFTLTTSATDILYFSMSATGTFYVDCGTNGTLTGTGVSGNKITRTDTNKSIYYCSYTGTNATRTIQFGGEATGYSTSNTMAAISFRASNGDGLHDNINAEKVTHITGSLGAIFHTISATGDAQPRFYQTFYGTEITSVPFDLFYGVTVGAAGMFAGTFYDCYKLRNMIEGNVTTTYIPSTFLSHIDSSTITDRMTSYMFYGSILDDPCPFDMYAVSTTVAPQSYNAQKPWCDECPSSNPKREESSDDSISMCYASCTLACSTPATCSVTNTQSCSYNTTVMNNGKKYYDTNTCVNPSNPVCPLLDVVCKSGYTKFGSAPNLSCVANTYMVTFNANGGSGSPNKSSVTCTYGQNCPAFANAGTLTKTGYTFGGWNTKTDGTGTTYTAGATPQNLTDKDGTNINLYVKWTANSVNINYDLNGGSGNVENTTCEYDSTFTLPSIPTKPGYRFKGWLIQNGV